MTVFESRPRVRLLRAGLAAAALVLVQAACFHARVTTGHPPGPDVIKRPWASAFLFGLVPPEILDGSTLCPVAGVATVETSHSFMNSFVGIVTVGVYTPMTITITCAGPGRRP